MAAMIAAQSKLRTQKWTLIMAREKLPTTLFNFACKGQHTDGACQFPLSLNAVIGNRNTAGLA
jgi:hypothetical protein